MPDRRQLIDFAVIVGNAMSHDLPVTARLVDGRTISGMVPMELSPEEAATLIRATGRDPEKVTHRASAIGGIAWAGDPNKSPP